MFVIDKNKKIILTKGDTASIHVDVVTLDNKKREEDTDVITLTVKKTPSSTAAITKVAGDNNIVFLPEDTSNLSSGLYVYDVQLETQEGNIYTIVPESFFQLVNEVS